MLDTTTLLQLTPPKYKVTYLPAPPAAQQQQQGSLTAQEHEQLLIEQAVAAAASFRAVAAQASGSSTANAGAAAANGSSSNSSAMNGHVHGQWKPFMAPLLVNDRVTSEDHFQETRFLEFDLSGSGLQYQPGDLLAIFPRTPAADAEVCGAVGTV